MVMLMNKSDIQRRIDELDDEMDDVGRQIDAIYGRASELEDEFETLMFESSQLRLKLEEQS
jgi:regulator of replication initiation timing